MTPMKNRLKYISPVLALGFATTHATAALTLISYPGTGMDRVNYTTADGTGNVAPNRAISAAVNGSGLSTLSGKLVHSSANGDNSNTVNPISGSVAGQPLAGILIDLGSTQNIGLMQLWNANHAGFAHGFDKFSMSYATDAAAVTLLESRLVISNLGLFTSLTTNTAMPMQTRNNEYLGETFTFGAVDIPDNLGDNSGTVNSLSANPIAARYVFLGNLSRAGGQSAGIAEVQFYAIPEPSSALLGGLGLLALMRRRRA